MAAHLRLVEDFSDTRYEHPRVDDLFDSQDQVERQMKTTHLRNALEALGIQDFKIVQDPEKIVTYLKSDEDLNRLSLKMAKKEEIPYEFWTADPDYDFRKLKRNTRRLQQTVDRTYLKGSISIQANRAARSIVSVADSLVAQSLFARMFLEEVDMEPPRRNDNVLEF